MAVFPLFVESTQVLSKVKATIKFAGLPDTSLARKKRILSDFSIQSRHGGSQQADGSTG